eukprot:Rmarinus@m.7558
MKYAYSHKNRPSRLILSNDMNGTRQIQSCPYEKDYLQNNSDDHCISATPRRVLDQYLRDMHLETPKAATPPRTATAMSTMSTYTSSGDTSSCTGTSMISSYSEKRKKLEELIAEERRRRKSYEREIERMVKSQ